MVSRIIENPYMNPKSSLRKNICKKKCSPCHRLVKKLISCDNCGKKFHPDSHYRQRKHHFCSKQCYYEYAKNHKLGFKFPKGNPFHWKKLGLKHPQLGRKRSPKTRLKIKLANVKYKQDVKEGLRKSHITKGFREKISLAGRERWDSCTPEERAKWLNQIRALGHSLKGRRRFDLAELNRKLKKGKNNPWWMGGTSLFRGHGWNKIRQQIWQRDKNVCQDCGEKKEGRARVAHHIVPYKLSKNNDPTNLITYCNKCHRKRENQFVRLLKEAKEVELILPEKYMKRNQLTMAEMMENPRERGLRKLPRLRNRTRN